MWSQSGIKGIATVMVVAATVAGCSEIYFDRRETVSLGAGDAVATNKVTHTIDPWSRASTNNNIAFNGMLMQSAQDRYNRGKVITPVLPTQASKDYQSAQSGAASSQAATSQSVAPAVAVKGATSPGNGP